MNENKNSSFVNNAKETIRSLVSLTRDKADDEIIDARIRGDIEMRGSNLWVLMFAIFVASIGLNVNSTAVIIGAMLISPLMGPIMGIGYGAGINDFALLRKSFKNLAIATLIGLLTSTFYFAISPLSSAQSELLARTTPTVWDVLIGFFGGLAGIVAITRKEKTNVIPGVAIATALMPPLCTAGYGLASGYWSYFFGAFYLYIINFVFIALSSFLIVRVFNVSEKKYVDEERAKKAQKYIIAVAIATILPSSYLAYELVKEELFKSKASAFATSEFNFTNTTVSQVKINPKKKTVKVFLVGEHIPQTEIERITERLSVAGLDEAALRVYQSGEKEELDVAGLKADIVSELYKDSLANMETKTKELERLKKEISGSKEYFVAIPLELEIIFPKVKNVILSESYDINASESNSSKLTKKTLILNAKSKAKITKTELQQIESWLKKRVKNDNVLVFIK